MDTSCARLTSPHQLVPAPEPRLSLTERGSKAAGRVSNVTKRVVARTRAIYPLWQLQLPHSSCDPMSYSPGFGSHTIRGGTITGCDMVTIGNTLSGGGRNVTANSSLESGLSGHSFSRIRVSNTGGLHIGNTGPGSPGHEVDDPEVQGVGGVVVGDFDNEYTKVQYFEPYQSHVDPRTRA
ncbi:hypothetical protein ANO14919_121170 [Xylariales sp. No.14919]|nr:hypothetical protein ANO14919_121170 [Xylariales sp. No.14919]